MANEGGPVPARFDVRVPTELEGGVYSNFLSVWHTAHEFTLDFAVTQPPVMATADDGTPFAHVPCTVTSRVKIPTTVLFGIIQALNDNMTKYEAELGEIPKLGGEGPFYPPPDLEP